jgi:hypothetical protein
MLQWSQSSRLWSVLSCERVPLLIHPPGPVVQADESDCEAIIFKGQLAIQYQLRITGNDFIDRIVMPDIRIDTDEVISTRAQDAVTGPPVVFLSPLTCPTEQLASICNIPGSQCDFLDGCWDSRTCACAIIAIGAACFSAHFRIHAQCRSHL